MGAIALWLQDRELSDLGRPVCYSCSGPLPSRPEFLFRHEREAERNKPKKKKKNLFRDAKVSQSRERHATAQKGQIGKQKEPVSFIVRAGGLITEISQAPSHLLAESHIFVFCYFATHAWPAPRQSETPFHDTFKFANSGATIPRRCCSNHFSVYVSVSA